MAAKTSGELERLLRIYTEELDELCHICNITPERGFGKRKRNQAIKRITESLIKSHHEKHTSCESDSTDVSTIHDIIKRGIKVMKTLSGPVQPCASSASVTRIRFDVNERKDFIKHWEEMTQRFTEESRKELDIPTLLENIIDVQSQDIDCVELSFNCKSCSEFKDPCDWTPTEPSNISDDAQMMKYRLSLSSGRYECMRTGLRVECCDDVKLEYHMCDWESVYDVFHEGNYTPCGPLMDIKVISGEVKAVYLPHFLCLGGGNVEDAVTVLHVEDDGYSLEKCELTRFHAKLLDNTFSVKGLLSKIGFPVNYHCQTLIYQTVQSHLTLHVYLIPSDKKMKEAVEREENKKLFIPKPRLQHSLQMNSWFRLKTPKKRKKSKCNSEITPESLKLMHSLNFFEVFMKSPKEDFRLQLMPEKSHEVLWDVTIREGDYKSRACAVDGRSESYSSDDEDRSHVSHVLLKCLNELKSEDLQLFTWHLAKGVDKIPKSKLENKARWEVVSCMIDHYHEDGAVKLTVSTLKKINHNNLAKNLCEELDVKDTAFM